MKDESSTPLMPASGKPRFPVLRWLALLWLAVWIPAYWHAWGGANFLHLCDIAVFLCCAGFWRGDALLLSSQLTGTLIADAGWCLDVCWHLATGHGLIGGTEYMWNAQVALWVRLLSLFHFVLPVLLLYATARLGYDRRAFRLQAGITVVLLVVSRFFGPVLNLNYAYRDILFDRSWGPAPVHLAVIFVGMCAVLYWPVHLVCSRVRFAKAGA